MTPTSALLIANAKQALAEIRVILALTAPAATCAYEPLRVIRRRA